MHPRDVRNRRATGGAVGASLEVWECRYPHPAWPRRTLAITLRKDVPMLLVLLLVAAAVVFVVRLAVSLNKKVRR